MESHEPLKLECFLPWLVEEKVRFKEWDSGGGPAPWGAVEVTLGAENDLWLIVHKETESSVLHHEELHSSSNLS